MGTLGNVIGNRLDIVVVHTEGEVDRVAVTASDGRIAAGQFHNNNSTRGQVIDLILVGDPSGNRYCCSISGVKAFLSGILVSEPDDFQLAIGQIGNVQHELCVEVVVIIVYINDVLLGNRISKVVVDINILVQFCIAITVVDVR